MYKKPLCCYIQNYLEESMPTDTYYTPLILSSNSSGLRYGQPPQKTPGPGVRRHPSQAIRPNNEQAYVYWIKKFILFHNKRHPKKMGTGKVQAFLPHLALEGHISASPIYTHVLNREQKAVRSPLDE